MRIALVYPPPFAIPPFGDEPPPAGALPAKGWEPSQGFGGDEITMPYGLMSLEANARQAGHDVSLMNLYTFGWSDVKAILSRVRADVYGLSCLTANRRGTQAAADIIRKYHPASYILAGGPHASALAPEVLKHWPAVDGVVVGEGEATFLDMMDRMAHRRPLAGTPGLVSREKNGGVTAGPQRPRLEDLDRLISPYHYWSGNIVLSARGCPNRCIFCGSPAFWGSRVRFLSAHRTLDILENLVSGHGETVLAVKDDTFTCSRQRVLDICAGIRKRGLNFLWSCDTRADRLDGELLYAMRRAGCQRISIGVESADSGILKTIGKGIIPERVLASTRLAKTFGFDIRFYMMAGNPGETADTLKASIAFLQRAKPSAFVYSILSLYPGTEVFHRAEAMGMADCNMFFTRDAPVFKCFMKKAWSPDLPGIVDWVLSHSRVTEFWRYGIGERKAVVKRFPDLATAHSDLAAAFMDAGRYAEAEESIHRALQLDHPQPGVLYNDLAVMADRQGKRTAARKLLEQAASFGYHPAVDDNLDRLQQPNGNAVARLAALLPLGFHRNVPLRQPAEPGPIEMPGSENQPSQVFMPQLFGKLENRSTWTKNFW